MKDYRIQVKKGKKWAWGLHDYTMEQAEARKLEMEAVGIKCRVANFKELVLGA